MKQITLSRWLKLIIIGAGICGLLIYAWIIPSFGKEVALDYPELAGAYVPWLGFLWASGIPCYATLYFAWKIASNIGADRSFCGENGKYMKTISIMAGGDALFFFLGNLILLLMNMNHPGVVLVSLVVVFVGVGISVAAAALSHLIMKAADLQEQSDFTI